MSEGGDEGDDRPCMSSQVTWDSAPRTQRLWPFGILLEVHMLPSLPRLRLPAETEFADTGGPLRSLSLVDRWGFLRAMLL